MQAFLISLLPALAAGGGVLVALGGAMMLMGALLMRSYASLWRRGIEVRAEILKTYGPKMADIRFEDQSGRAHLIRRCMAPSYGMLHEGTRRTLTYLPGKPEKWQWRPRSYHRWMTFFSLYIVTLGLVVLMMGVEPLWPEWLHHLERTLRHHPHDGWMEAPPGPR